MQLGLSFSVLLTTLLFALAQAAAVPVKRSPGVVTLPLKRLAQQPGVHPTVVSCTLELAGIVVLITPPSAIATAYQPQPPSSCADERLRGTFHR